tara:strand:- start:35 stop:361 length:327 start_codon:yes stop_codon:yes gene_type:complete
MKGYREYMDKKTAIKEMESILKDYRDTMTKDLEQALINYLEDLQPVKCRICKIEPAMQSYRTICGQTSKVLECDDCRTLTNQEAYKRMNREYNLERNRAYGIYKLLAQ